MGVSLSSQNISAEDLKVIVLSSKQTMIEGHISVSAPYVLHSSHVY